MTATPIIKINNEYRVAFDTHTLVYNKNGHYLGQWQEDITTPGEVFIIGLNLPPLTHAELTNLEMLANA